MVHSSAIGAQVAHRMTFVVMLVMSFALGCGPLEEERGHESEAGQAEAMWTPSWEEGVSTSSAPDACVDGDTSFSEGDHEEDDVQENHEERFEKRLHRDPRTAIKLEAFYALSRAHDGRSRVPLLGGMTVGDWNYLANDRRAYQRGINHLACCSSLWTQNGSCPVRGCYGGPFKRMGHNSFYDNVNNYGFFGGRGRGGQCYYFAELVLYRSGVRFHLPGVRSSRMLPTYTQVRNDYNGRRRYTKPVSQARVGDVLFTRNSNGHVAIVVGILEGRAGHNVRAVDVVDSNFVTWGGADEEIIGRHPIRRSGRGLGDLDNYIAVDVTRHLRE